MTKILHPIKFCKTNFLLAISTTALIVSGAANAQVSQRVMTPVNSISEYTADYGSVESLKPQLPTKYTRIDYTVLDEMLENSVLFLGFSTRRHMSRPQISTNTRIVRGHRSPYRLEGSRVSFSFLNEAYKNAFTEYRVDLERIGSSIDLTRLPKNEQLAFWLNLHNTALVEQISKQYPTRRPSNLKIDGIPIDDAKILTVKGVSLSLRDIRERIVYANWSEPEVMYGFFKGDIGSPAFQDEAYTGKNVKTILQIQANEFVNSLRGFNETSRHREVSRLYQDVQPFYFQNWEVDLQAHLLKYATAELKPDVLSGKPFAIDKYDDVIADLMGGDRPRITAGNMTNSEGYAVNDFRIPSEVGRLIKELQTKRDVMKSRGMLKRGIVIIEDIETPSVEPTYDPSIDPESSLYVPSTGN